MYEDHIYKSKENDNNTIIIVYPSHFSLAINDLDIWDVGAYWFRNHGL